MHSKVDLDTFSGSFTTIDDRAISFALLLDYDQIQSSGSIGPLPDCTRPLSR